jgi:metal-responsive CopG/Arc/MetJ family transcriptional regulator
VSCYIHCIGMTNSTRSDDNTDKLGITLPKSMIERIDKARGDVPRSRFIRRAIESYLKGTKKGK